MIRVSRPVAVLAAGLWLTACASTPAPPGPSAVGISPPSAAAPRPVAEPAPPPVPPLSFSDLPGWGSEDHAVALQAFQAGCGAARDMDLHAVCLRARALSLADETTARIFLETNFRPQRVGEHGLLTAYFAPEYEARTRRGGVFTAPVREKPADLVTLDLGAFDPSLSGKKVSGHVVGGAFAPYPDRADIEAAPAQSPPARG